QHDSVNALSIRSFVGAEQSRYDLAAQDTADKRSRLPGLTGIEKQDRRTCERAAPGKREAVLRPDPEFEERPYKSRVKQVDASLVFLDPEFEMVGLVALKRVEGCSCCNRRQETSRRAEIHCIDRRR